MMRVGLFGGAFDPPHIGHLICAEYALEELQLDKIIFIPSGDHPFKREAVTASGADRYAMTKLATGREQRFEVSDIELLRTGISYSIDTIEFLRAANPDWDLYILIGADNIADFPKWHRFEDILRTAKVAIVERLKAGDRELVSSYLDKFIFLDTPVIEISSTEIRSRFREKKRTTYLITQDVEKYILERGLYSAS